MKTTTDLIAELRLFNHHESADALQQLAPAPISTLPAPPEPVHPDPVRYEDNGDVRRNGHVIGRWKPVRLPDGIPSDEEWKAQWRAATDAFAAGDIDAAVLAADTLTDQYRHWCAETRHINKLTHESRYKLPVTPPPKLLTREFAQWLIADAETAANNHAPSQLRTIRERAKNARSRT